MIKPLNHLMLTLAGLGLLSGAATGSADVDRLHSQVRGRAPRSECSESLRAFLSSDTQFGQLLEGYRRRSLIGHSGRDDAEDALNEALLRIWKRRPEVLLLPPAEVVRYLRVAVAQNLISLRRQEASPVRRARVVAQEFDSLEDTSRHGGDPVEAAEFIEALKDGLTSPELAVIDAYLEGGTSQRAVARVSGLSRHAVACAERSIGQRLRTLLRAEA